MVKLLLFTFLYNLIANWIQIYYLGKNLFNPIKKDPLQDEISLELKERMESVTGLDLKIKIIAENKKAIGFMMTSPPFPPVMLFSKRLYDLFNDEEMEWVILHESGHYIFKHNLKLILLDIVFSVINAFIIYKFELPIVIALSFTICIALSFTICIALIQI
jgi:Zn-dependent protease with chaperone function